ncbi:MAG: galactosyltransferase-related protein [Humidesulfovibrio sp.]|nr:galactosyltransferase-related protein [Humidesulfovibrio sp.]
MPALSDTSILIPVRFDSSGRVRNLKVVLRFLLAHVQAPILLCEEDKKPHAREFLPEFLDRIGYLFLETDAPYFHKTRCLNHLARAAHTPYLLSHDTDVLVPPSKYATAHALLERGADMVFPYDGLCLTVSGEQIARIWADNTLDHLSAESCPLHAPRLFGGCVFLRRRAFMEAGMENENFRSWGGEDDERVTRFGRLGFRAARIAGPLFHLEHPRPPEHIGTGNPFYAENEREYQKVLAMPPEALRAYVATWPWVQEMKKEAREDA